MLPTFPYFQLSRCGNLIEDLRLSQSSYLDSWIPSSYHWEQQTISTVLIVESRQRLLFKIRPSLTESLLDSECLSLQEELHLLGGNTDSQSRRLFPSGGTSASSSLSKSSRSNGLQKHPHNPTSDIIATIPPFDVPTKERVPSTRVPSTPQRQTSATAPFSFSHYFLTPPASPPVSDHPPLKRWPNSYTVSQICTGFHNMDLLIANRASSGRMTQRQAFKQVFGCRYIKSTFCRHRALWRKANNSTKESFAALGTDEGAFWGEFVRRVEGRQPRKRGGLGGKSSPEDQIASPSPTAVSGGEEDHVQI